MNKYDKMVLRAIAKEYNVKANQITFLEGDHVNDRLTKVVFKIRYNMYENIVYSCMPYFGYDSVENKLTVTLYQNCRIGTWTDYNN